jgi:hypothetical protein
MVQLNPLASAVLHGSWSDTSVTTRQPATAQGATFEDHLIAQRKHAALDFLDALRVGLAPHLEEVSSPRPPRPHRSTS